MKKILFCLALLNSISSYATTVTIERSVYGSSLKSCQEANQKLSTRVLNVRGEVLSIQLKECKTLEINGRFGEPEKKRTLFSQEAKLVIQVDNVIGNY